MNSKNNITDRFRDRKFLYPLIRQTSREKRREKQKRDGGGN